MWNNKGRLNVVKFLNFMNRLDETERVRLSLISLNEILEDSQKGMTEGLDGESLIPAFLAMDEYLTRMKMEEFQSVRQTEEILEEGSL